MSAPRRHSLLGSRRSWLAAVVAAAAIAAGVLSTGAVAAIRPTPASISRPSVLLCAMHNDVNPRPPRSLSGAPPAPMLALLGVLRRPQVPADALPAKPPLPLLPFTGIDSAYVRRVATNPAGDRFYLVPGIVRLIVPGQCAAGLTRAQRRTLSRPHFSLGISEFSRDGLPDGVVDGRAPAAEAIAAGALTGGGISVSQKVIVNPGNQLTYSNAHVVATIDGVVPDGVAGVTLVYRHRRARTLPVANNFFELTLHRVIATHSVFSSSPKLSTLRAVIQPIELVWRDAQGHAIKTVAQVGACLLLHGKAVRRCVTRLPQAQSGPPL